MIETLIDLRILLATIALLFGFAWATWRWGLKVFRLMFAGSISFMFGHLTYIAISGAAVDTPVPVLLHPLFYAIVGACMAFILLYWGMWGKVVKVK